MTDTDSSDLTARVFDDEDTGAIDPFAVFTLWLEDARQSEPNDPNAMALASVDAEGMPDLRMVLLNGRDARGFVFYTNFESAKGHQLLAQPKAALLFHWKTQRRQIRIRGPLETVSDAEADEYFASRHPTSRRGAHASQQSRTLARRADLEAALGEMEALYPDDDAIPRPSYWSGFRLKPLEIEFWKDGAYRLHDRMLFRRAAPDARWSRTRLYP